MFSVVRSLRKINAFTVIACLSLTAFALSASAQTKKAKPAAPPKGAKAATATKATTATKASAPDRPKSDAAPAAAGSEVPEGEEAPPAAPPPPGFVVITVDTEGLSAVVGGEVHGLKKGANRFELPAGSATIEVQGKGGKSIQKTDVVIDSAKDAQVSVTLTGKLVINGDALAISVDGKDLKKDGASAQTQLLRGKHSVVVTQPGRIGIKSQVEVLAGRTHTIDPRLERFDAGDKRLAWASVLGGGGLIVAAVILERFVDSQSLGGDTTRWIMVGGGIAGFAGGTIMMKKILKREANPPVQDGKLDVKVSAAQRRDAARNVAAR